MIRSDDIKALNTLIDATDFAELRTRLAALRPQEIAALLPELPAGKQVLAFRALPRRLAAAVFEYLPASDQRDLVKTMGQEEMARLLNEMAPDDRTVLLGELPANVTKQLLALLTPE